jgi:hypothetical protein
MCATAYFCSGFQVYMTGGGNILRAIRDDLAARSDSSSQKISTVPNDKEFFESAYVSLDAVRVAWRNITMHVENKYTMKPSMSYCCKGLYEASRFPLRREPRPEGVGKPWDAQRPHGIRVRNWGWVFGPTSRAMSMNRFDCSGSSDSGFGLRGIVNNLSLF